MKLSSILTTICIVSTLASVLLPMETKAANSRQAWVVQQIHDYNHPFAANLPNELATKMTKMAVNAFSFYRGTAHLFYEDTKKAASSAYTNKATNSTWLEGDMHLQNVGGFRDAEDKAVFDTNDFDEGYWGSYTWDVRRMAVAILLAAEENGIESSDRESLVKNFVESYANQVADFKGNDTELSFHLTASNTSGVVKDIIQAADGKKRSSILSKYTTVQSGQRRFQNVAASLQPVNSSTLSELKTAMTGYINSIPTAKRKNTSYYTLKDAALRLGSGTGSLGRYRYYLLIEGDSADVNDDVILEMKQETDSAVAIAAPGNMPASVYNSHNGERVVKTMNALLNKADVLAGYTTFNNLPFFLRERSPYQEDFDYTQLKSYSSFNEVVKYVGKVLAKSHALADKDYDAKLIPVSMDKEITLAINGDVSGLKKEILKYALEYAEQVKQDYHDFVKAKNSGTALY